MVLTKNKAKKAKKKKGFTLVEIILVIVIVGALLLIIIPRIDNLISNGKMKYYTTITGDVIYTIKGQPIDIWNYITVSDNFYSVDEITKGYTEIDQVNINVPGSYRVKITATDKGGNKKEKEVLVKVIERIVTFTPEERDWDNRDVTVTMTLNNIAGLEVASWRCRKGILGQEGTTWGSAVVGTGTSADITLSENGINIIEVEVTYTDGTVLLNGRTCSDSSTKYVCPNSGCYGNDSQCHWYNSSGASCPSAYGSSKYNY